MKHDLRDLWQGAVRVAPAGRVAEATRALRHALSGLQPGRGAAPGPSPMAAPTWLRERDGAFEVDTEADADASVRADTDDGVAPRDERGHTSGVHRHGGLERSWKLLVPPAPGLDALPLVVMLHGCTQDPDDFAAGTRMNEHARARGFAVLYPAQSAQANASRCWNWFKHNHQDRDRGEPAFIADLTLAMVRRHGFDAGRVYVAGLSAGGAMAAILADAWPDVYAAAGVHSGLARGAAHDLAGALSAMQQGGTVPPRADGAPAAAPTIVFHGDQDRTVHPRNGEQALAAALRAADRKTGDSPIVERGVAAGGGRYTRRTYPGPDGQGPPRAEHWTLHGASHAWSGGDPAGSYTDGRGPDASAEMLRFFLQQRLHRGA